SRQNQRNEAGKEISLRVLPLLRRGAVELVLPAGAQEVCGPAGEERDLAVRTLHVVETRGRGIRREERKNEQGCGGGRRQRSSNPLSRFAGRPRHPFVQDDGAHQKDREDPVVDVRRGVPGEKQAEENLVAAPPALEVVEQEEQRERQEGAPLELQMGDLRDAPGKKRVDEAGEEGRRGMTGDPAGQSPGREGGKKH